MKTLKHKYSKKPYVAILIVAFVLIAGGGITYALISSQPAPNSPDNTPQTELKENQTDSAEPSNEQVDAGNQVKEETVDNQSSVSEVSVSIVPYKKDGYTIKVDSTINANLNAGKCDLIITNGNITKNYSSDIQQLANYSTCKGFEIPVSDLGSGNWKINLNVSSKNYKGTTSSSIDT